MILSFTRVCKEREREDLGLVCWGLCSQLQHPPPRGTAIARPAEFSSRDGLFPVSLHYPPQFMGGGYHIGGEQCKHPL